MAEKDAVLGLSSMGGGAVAQMDIYLHKQKKGKLISHWVAQKSSNSNPNDEQLLDMQSGVKRSLRLLMKKQSLPNEKQEAWGDLTRCSGLSETTIGFSSTVPLAL